jgi:hypothetical protein
MSKRRLKCNSFKIVILPEMKCIMKHLIFFMVTGLVFLIAACGPSDEDKARAKLNFAKVLLEKQDTSAALVQLDSILKLYPKAPYSQNAAKNLISEINFELLHRKETALDTIKALISELEKSFVKEKTEYDRYTQYIHKHQTLQGSLIRSFIQIHPDERGNLYMSSNYHGKNSINHYGIRVYDAEISAKTDSIPAGDSNNHQSDFMEYKWEKVSYRNGKDNGVIEFIANHADRKLNAVFLGKGQYYIILEEFDKIAFKDALALSKAIKSKNELEKEIEDLQKKLQIN